MEQSNYWMASQCVHCHVMLYLKNIYPDCNFPHVQISSQDETGEEGKLYIKVINRIMNHEPLTKSLVFSFTLTKSSLWVSCMYFNTLLLEVT